jgi:hypothetical protein
MAIVRQSSFMPAASASLDSAARALMKSAPGPALIGATALVVISTIDYRMVPAARRVRAEAGGQLTNRAIS